MRETNLEGIVHEELTTEPKSTNQWSVWAIVFLVVLMPLFFLPLNFSTFGASKTLVFAILTLFSAFVLIVRHLKKNELRLPINLISLSLLLIPVVYLISSFATSNWRHALWGNNFSVDSALFISMLILLVFIVSIAFKDSQKTITLYFGLIISFVLSLLLVVINILPGEILSGLNFFFSNTSNTVGKWFDFGILSAVVLVLSLFSVEFLKLKALPKNLFLLMIVLSMFCLVAVGFNFLWLIILIVSLLLFVYLITIYRSHVGQDKFNFPTITLFVFILSFVFLIGSNLISSGMQRMLSIDNSDIRIGFEAGNEMISRSLSAQPFFGFGPNNFIDAFNLFKTPAINITDLWAVDFNYTYGYLHTVPITVGLAGFFAWAFLFVLFLVFGFKSIFKKVDDVVLKYVNVSSFFTTLFLWLTIIFYTVGIVILVLFAVFLGVFIATLYEMGILRNIKILVTKNPKTGFAYVFVLVLLLLGTIVVTYIYVEKFVADYNFVQANQAISKSDWSRAENHLIKAIQFDISEMYLFTYSDLMNLNIGNLLNNSNVPEADRPNIFRNYLSNSIRAVQNASLINPENYQSYQRLGNIFSSMMDLKIADSFTEAKNFYNKSLEYSPQNPGIYLGLAQIEIKNNNNAEAEKYIRKALELKPNYVDAIFLYSQMQIRAGDTERAIESAESALVVRPNDPTVSFQLGLLNYETAKYSRAVEHFERAVTLNQRFMNARFYLGLSYARENRQQDAIKQFEILNQANPENVNISEILKKLQKGESLFEPVTVEPQKDELPVKEEEQETQ